MRAFFTCTNVKSSIRNLNTISYIHIIVFLISNLNDLIKVFLRAMGYEFDMKGDEVNNKGKGEGDEEWGLICADSVFVFEPCICKIQLNY